MSNLLLKNIGTIVSGDLNHPIIEGDAILVENKKISRVGKLADFGQLNIEKTIDCNGTTVTPGLIDSHCHPILGDYTSRQNQAGFLESELHGGVTTIISAGEVHLKGRPKDRAGVKALAILAAKSFNNFRPGGAKVIGGAVILEKGLLFEDFKEMANEGVTLVGEIGLGSVKDPKEAAVMVGWAKECGMTVMMHTGGTSIPGSSSVTADMVIEAGPDIASHINGGPTAVSMDEVKKLVTDTEVGLEIVHCGNPLMAVNSAAFCVEKDQLHRVIIGNDAPSGTGVVPLGILRVINLLASMTPISAAQAICMATGNTARLFNLDTGMIKQGSPADLVIMDSPMGSVGDNALEAIEAGDVPGVGMVLVDGEIVVPKSRNTPPAATQPQLL
ncbi:MAG: amidohydrolase family protein [Deltaproteobacteria bacterium]|jgi:enamidase|nr:amidohydrolase family protein [Deltaproteobacteria bacterium]MBT4265306.1 amidohydrolase family protein [Deltaproteobacteria bacterium]MBT4637864.1 amidohydrolase family protein [Deltaproteobacteria bacterium]